MVLTLMVPRSLFLVVRCSRRSLFVFVVVIVAVRRRPLLCRPSSSSFVVRRPSSLPLLGCVDRWVRKWDYVDGWLGEWARVRVDVWSGLGVSGGRGEIVELA